MRTPEVSPYLWFDSEAVQAAEFYVSVFPNSRIISKNLITDTPSGDCEEVFFTLNGQRFNAISAGPFITKNPSVSFIVNFDPGVVTGAETLLKETWEALSQEGKVMMELGQYPFSPLYGWVEDRYGVSWQLMLTNPAGDPRPFIIPSLLFCNQAFGKAEAAFDYYLDIFGDSERGQLVRYQQSAMEAEVGKIMFADIRLSNLWMAASESAYDHGFSFSEGISFLIQCDTQSDLDYFWEKLSASADSEQCGWCRDKFGLFWQINPFALETMMEEGSRSQIDAVTQSFLGMKKLEIKELTSRYRELSSPNATIEVVAGTDLQKAWDFWTAPEHVENWYFASDDWHVTKVSNEVSVGGCLTIGMSAKDGSAAFDFTGVYSKVDPKRKLIFVLDDGRKVIVRFEEHQDGVLVSETFDLEASVDRELQIRGWQSILEQFKKYIEKS